jgi:phospholipase/carboxylesterase
MTDAAFIHRYRPAKAAGRAPLLLLHGTGGNEDDLIPIADVIAPQRALISPRGKVLEGTMPRFFRRLAEGVFDEADVVFRAHELADFVAATRTKHQLQPPVAVGFSNGANIAAALLLLRPESLSGAVLIRAMTPLHKTRVAPDLNGKPILILSGAMDPIIPASNAAHLADAFKAHGATVDHEILPASHSITRGDMNLAKAFLDAIG